MSTDLNPVKLDKRLKENRAPLPKAALKKGNPTWSPANVAEIQGKEDGYRYRKIRKDTDNISRKKQEGWDIVSGINGQETSSQAGYGRINDGTALTSAREGTDWVLGRIPEEEAQKRDAYFNNETARRTQGLTAHIKKDIREKGGNAPVHGDITISSRTGTQVIE